MRLSRKSWLYLALTITTCLLLVVPRAIAIPPLAPPTWSNPLAAATSPQSLVAQATHNPLAEAQRLNAQGHFQLERGQVEAAFATFRSAEQAYRAEGDPMGQMLSQLNQVQALQSLGFYTRARRLLLDLDGELARSPHPQLKLQQLRSLGSVLQNVGELEQARAVLAQALSLAEAVSPQEAGARQDIAALRFQLGNLAQIEQDWTEAAAQYEAVLQAVSNPASSPVPTGEMGDRLALESQLQLLRLAVKAYNRQISNIPDAPNPPSAPDAPKVSEVSDALGLFETSRLEFSEPSTGEHDPSVQLSKSRPQGAIADQAEALRSLLDALPLSRWAVDARIHWSESLLQLGQVPGGRAQARPSLRPSLRSSPLLPEVGSQLALALNQAQQLSDSRVEALVLGQLAALYEQEQRWTEALGLTRRALEVTTRIDAPDLAARWHWQAGRLLRQQGQEEAAIAQYQTAIDLIQDLRQDLVAMTSDLQFSFRDQVEPLYRQQIQLLLNGVDELPATLKQQRLEQSRQTLEALQLAELQNFFREACQTYEPRSIDQIDPQAAVIYSLVLEGRLEVILSLPNQPLQHYGSDLSPSKAQQLQASLRQSLNPAFRPEEGRAAAQQLYDELIRPAEPALEALQIKTLVFVLDDFLRGLPMAVLWDGDRYLVEKYSLALTPGLQLFDSRLPKTRRRPRFLIGGLSQAHQGFAALPGVEQELETLAHQVSTQALLNQDFERSALAQQFEDKSFSGIHLATHGQFSSRAQDTFLLAWNERIGVQDLDQWLSQQARRVPLELLTLSACQTAKGDDRATLGLAGVAVRSGARTTLATLWSVQDESTSQFMAHFYQQLLEQDVGRAEALRQAQLQLLHGAYSHPYYWAPFVMVGHWR